MAGPTGSRDRLAYLDNLRLALALLVVASHVGLAYGWGDFWYVADSGRDPLIGAFFEVNRAFFMSAFFLVAGYLTPGSYDRRGAAGFLKWRLAYFGLPLLVFLLLVFPPLMHAYYVNFRPYGPLPFATYLVDVYFGAGHRPAGWSGPYWPDHQLGHLWFVEHLLFLSLLYALWRRLRIQPAPAGDGRLPGLPAILFFVIVIALASFAMRLWKPVFSWTAWFGILQVQPANVPRDWAFFVLGIVACRRNWFARFPTAAGMAWLAAGVAAAALGVTARLGGRPLFVDGGWSWPALLYAGWETLVCTGLCLGLLVLFRERADVETPLTRALSRNAYAVYLWHVPVVVLIQYGLRGLGLPLLAKFGLGVLIAVPATFALCHAVRSAVGGRLRSGSSSPRWSPWPPP